MPLRREQVEPGDLIRLPSLRIVQVDRVQGETVGASYWQPRVGRSPHEVDRVNFTLDFLERWGSPTSAYDTQPN